MTTNAYMPDDLTTDPALSDSLSNLVSCMEEINMNVNTINEAIDIKEKEATLQASVVEQAIAFAAIAKARLNDSFAKFLGATRDYVGKFFETRDVFLNVRQRSTTQMLKTGNYTNLMEKRIVVPVGFNTTLLEHLRRQLIIVSIFKDMNEKLLNPLHRHLGLLLAEPSTISSNRSNDNLSGLKSINVDKTRELFAKDFAKDRAERRPYGTLVERLSDWDAVILTYNELVLIMNSIPRSEVQAKLDKILPLIDLLITRMTNEPEVYKASGVTVRSLSDFIFNLAKLIEFYSVFSFNLEAVGNTIDACYDLHKSV